MKIALITDAHANLPALQAALEAIRAEGCETVYHLGDAVAIGPFPAECVDLILSTPNLVPLAGNHEQYYLRGVPDPLPTWMSAGEAQHQRWTHAQLGTGRRAALAAWPLKLEMSRIFSRTKRSIAKRDTSTTTIFWSTADFGTRFEKVFLMYLWLDPTPRLRPHGLRNSHETKAAT